MVSTTNGEPCARTNSSPQSELWGGLLAVGCSPDSKSTPTTSTTANTGVATTTKAADVSTTTGEVTSTTAVIDGPHPGVTDTEIKIGVNGRQIKLIFAAIDPTSASSAEETCVKLAEDDDVFAVIGFFLNDAINCPLDTRANAVIGGNISTGRLAAAEAQWLSPDTGAEFPSLIINAFKDKGAPAGKFATIGNVDDQAGFDSAAAIAKGLGPSPVATALVDASSGDTAAMESNIELIAEKFKTAGADTILLVGANAASRLTTMQKDTTYRPKLLFTASNAIDAFAINSTTTEFTVLDGALAGGAFGPKQAVFDDADMQKCLAILTAAGLKVPSPATTKVEKPSFELSRRRKIGRES